MVWHFIGVYIINRIVHGRLEIRNFSSRVEKIFHSLAALTRERFFNTRREISYLHATMQYPLCIGIEQNRIILYSNTVKFIRSVKKKKNGCKKMTVESYMCQHLQFSVVYPYVKGTRIPSLDQLLVEQYDPRYGF